MVYNGFDFLPEYLEALYLGKDLTNRLSQATIVVNPLTDHYIYGKTIIINRPGLPKEYLEKLSKNNTIIYRIHEDVMYGELRPYFPKMIRSISWAGYSIPTVSLQSAQELPDYFCSPSHINYPSVEEIPVDEVLDEEGNLNYLGYLLYQIGSFEWPTETEYSDLDLMKVGKLNP